jgi:hypothetical protein
MHSCSSLTEGALAHLTVCCMVVQEHTWFRFNPQFDSLSFSDAPTVFRSEHVAGSFSTHVNHSTCAGASCQTFKALDQAGQGGLAAYRKQFPLPEGAPDGSVTFDFDPTYLFTPYSSGRY